jgi:hypothetical protein
MAVAVPRYAAAQDERRIEFAGGYSLMRDYDGGATFPGGWFASVAADVAGPLALVGDASGSYKSMGGLDINVSTHIHTFMGGPRLGWRASRVAPYVQMLFGAARFSTTYTMPGERLSDARHYFAMAPGGGGVNIPFSSRGAVRVGANIRLIRSETYTPTGSEPFTYREFQFATGGSSGNRGYVRQPWKDLLLRQRVLQARFDLFRRSMSGEDVPRPIEDEDFRRALNVIRRRDRPVEAFSVREDRPRHSLFLDDAIDARNADINADADNRRLIRVLAMERFD